MHFGVSAYVSIVACKARHDLGGGEQHEWCSSCAADMAGG